MPRVTVGPLECEHIAIDVLRRKYPQARDYDDGNWVESDVSISIGPWRGSYMADLRTVEFARFRHEIAEMREGMAELDAIEQQFPVRGSRNG